MPKNTLWIAALLTALIGIGFTALYAKSEKQKTAQIQADYDKLRASIETHNEQAKQLLLGLEESKRLIEELQAERDQAAEAQRMLEKKMREAIESKDVTISELQGKLTINILDRILFDSGEAVIKPEGQQVLDQIAGILTQYPDRQVQVVGHTDNVPIRANPKNPFATNWELSAGRALAAVRYLSEKANVDPKRLAALGYGEFHPIADNSTPEGRARNRRIALVVLPEEIAASDLRFAAGLTNALAKITAGSSNTVVVSGTNAAVVSPTNAVVITGTNATILPSTNAP
jgi:chemotaxis protein MotB